MSGRRKNQPLQRWPGRYKEKIVLWVLQLRAPGQGVRDQMVHNTDSTWRVMRGHLWILVAVVAVSESVTAGVGIENDHQS
jgi:hypothetical protein